MAFYRICGLPVVSELSLPGAIATSPPPVPAEISIRHGLVPMALSSPSATGATWEMTSEAFLLRIPRVARFLISFGRNIAVELEPGAKERDAAAFLLGTVFGVLLHQRGALVLHGAAVAKDGRAIAICGVSGAGKSTLAAALCGAGFTFAADDLCVIGLDSSRHPVVLPDGRQLKLWTESIDGLDLAARRGEAIRDSLEKYFISPEETTSEPPRLSAIYILRDARPSHREGIERLALPDAMRTLEREVYRPNLRAKMGKITDDFAQAAQVYNHVKVYLLVRARGFERIPQTVEALNAHWNALD